MPSYTFRATDGDGQVVEGRIVSDSLASALADLEQQKLTITAINVEDVIVVSESSPGSSEANALSFQMVFERAVELVPLLQALSVDVESREIRRDLHRLADRIAKSRSIDDWVHDDLGTKTLPLLIRYAATDQKASGTEMVIRGLVGPLEAQTVDRRLFFYPIITFVLAGVVFCFLSIVVVPIFREMFNEFDLPVPQITESVLWGAEQITRHAVRTAVIFLGVITGACLARWWIRKGDWLNRLLGRLVAGRAGNLAAMHRLTIVLAESMAAGLPMDESLRVAGRASQRYAYQRATELLAIQGPAVLTSDVSTFASSLPATLRQVLCMGMSKGAAVDVLRELADNYLKRCQTSRVWLVTVFPVLLTVVLGIVVGVIVVALFAPLVSLVSSLAF